MKREQRSNKNLQTSLMERKSDPEKLNEEQPTGALPDPVNMAKTPVAKGRCLHLPIGDRHIVGTRPVEIDGTLIYKDVFAQEIRSAGPGEEVVLPVGEVERLRGLGYLVAIDDKPAKRGNGKGHSVTGIENDPRLRTAIR